VEFAPELIRSREEDARRPCAAGAFEVQRPVAEPADLAIVRDEAVSITDLLSVEAERIDTLTPSLPIPTIRGDDSAEIEEDRGDPGVVVGHPRSSAFFSSIVASRSSNDSANEMTPSVWRSAVTWSKSIPRSASAAI